MARTCWVPWGCPAARSAHPAPKWPVPQGPPPGCLKSSQNCPEPRTLAAPGGRTWPTQPGMSALGSMQDCQHEWPQQLAEALPLGGPSTASITGTATQQADATGGWRNRTQPNPRGSQPGSEGHISRERRPPCHTQACREPGYGGGRVRRLAEPRGLFTPTCPEHPAPAWRAGPPSPMRSR